MALCFRRKVHGAGLAGLKSFSRKSWRELEENPDRQWAACWLRAVDLRRPRFKGFSVFSLKASEKPIML